MMVHKITSFCRLQLVVNTFFDTQLNESKFSRSQRIRKRYYRTNNSVKNSQMSSPCLTQNSLGTKTIQQTLSSRVLTLEVSTSLVNIVENSRTLLLKPSSSSSKSDSERSLELVEVSRSWLFSSSLLSTSSSKQRYRIAIYRLLLQIVFRGY